MFVNRKLGSQHTFSQIDGEAGSLSGSENCSSTTEQQKEREEEKGEEEKKEEELEVKKEEEEKKMWEEWLKKKWEEEEKMVRPWKPETTQGDCSININEPTSTFGPPRDPTDPSASRVTAEPIDPNRCLRPVQRARERRAARLKEGSHADAEFGNELLVDPDPRSFECLPHVPAVKR